MSVDTTILILQCPDGYRVATVQAVENITEYKDIWVVQNYFGQSEIFEKLEDARHEAELQDRRHIDQMGYPSEYGIALFKWDNPIIQTNELHYLIMYLDKDNEQQLRIIGPRSEITDYGFMSAFDVGPATIIGSPNFVGWIPVKPSIVSFPDEIILSWKRAGKTVGTPTAQGKDGIPEPACVFVENCLQSKEKISFLHSLLEVFAPEGV